MKHALSFLGCLLAACEVPRSGPGGACANTDACRTGLVCSAGTCVVNESPGEEAQVDAPPTLAFANAPPAKVFAGEGLSVTVSLTQGNPPNATLAWSYRYADESSETPLGTEETAFFAPPHGGTLTLRARASSRVGDAEVSATVEVAVAQLPLLATFAAPVDGQTSGLFMVSSDGTHLRAALALDPKRLALGFSTLTDGTIIHADRGMNSWSLVRSGTTAQTELKAFSDTASTSDCVLTTSADGTANCSLLPLKQRLSPDGQTLVAFLGRISATNGPNDASNSATLALNTVGMLELFDLPAGTSRPLTLPAPASAGSVAISATEFVNDAAFAGAGKMVLAWRRPQAAAALQLYDFSDANNAVAGARADAPTPGFALLRPRVVSQNRVVFVSALDVSAPQAGGLFGKLSLSGPDLSVFEAHALATGAVEGYTPLDPTQALDGKAACAAAQAAQSPGVWAARGVDYDVSADGRTLLYAANTAIVTSCDERNWLDPDRFARFLGTIDISAAPETKDLLASVGLEPLTAPGLEQRTIVASPRFLAEDRQISFVTRSNDGKLAIYVANTDASFRNVRKIFDESTQDQVSGLTASPTALTCGSSPSGFSLLSAVLCVFAARLRRRFA